MSIITTADFKSLFELGDDIEVPRSTINQYVKYIKGSYRLYQHLVNISNVPFSMKVNGKTYELRCDYNHNCCYGYQDWISSLGACPKLEMCYLDPNGQWTPFWAYTVFNDDTFSVAVYLAYNMLTAHLTKLMGEYKAKYMVDFKYNNYLKVGRSSGLRGPIWLRGVEFDMQLQVKDNMTGEYKFISSYNILQTIHNRWNTCTYPLLEPVSKKIVDSITEKTNKKKLSN